jgi:hypothetical protein
MVKASGLTRGNILQLTLVTLIAFPTATAHAQLTKLPDKPKKTLAAYNPRTYAKAIEKPPAEFDLPLYISNVDMTKFTKLDAKKGSSTSAIIETSDPAQVAFEWYQSTLKSQGWEVQLPPSNKSSIFMLTAKKAGKKVMLSSFRPAKLNSTILSVSLTAQ